MDTSTLSSTEAEVDLPFTSVPYSSSPQPAAEWFTRLISPLTHVDSSAASPVPTDAMIASIEAEQYLPTPAIPAPRNDDDQGISTLLLVFIPIMVVVLTLLLGLVIFLVAMLYMRRKRGIRRVRSETRRLIIELT
jgi:hypothetical protein